MPSELNGIASHRSGYVPTLDGWRAVAILSVMFCHAGQDLFGPSGTRPIPRLEMLAILGANGVDLFFGISGLLIASRLLQERRLRGRVSLSSFYTRRLSRILPACYFFLGALWLLTLTTKVHVSSDEWRSALFFYKNYERQTGTWYTGHLWSLAVEEHFYLLLPACVALLTLRKAAWILAVASVAVATWRCIGETMFGMQTAARTDFRLDALLWGAVAALLCDGAAAPKVLGLARSQLGFPLAALVLLVAVWKGGLVGGVVKAILVPAVLVCTVAGRPAWLAAALESALLRWIGRLSYSLYLWQQVFLTGGRVPVPRPLGILQMFPWNILAVVACAAASYYCVERPITRLGRAWAPPPSPGRGG